MESDEFRSVFFDHLSDCVVASVLAETVIFAVNVPVGGGESHIGDEGVNFSSGLTEGHSDVAREAVDDTVDSHRLINEVLSNLSNGHGGEVTVGNVTKTNDMSFRLDTSDDSTGELLRDPLGADMESSLDVGSLQNVQDSRGIGVVWATVKSESNLSSGSTLGLVLSG